MGVICLFTGSPSRNLHLFFQSACPAVGAERPKWTTYADEEKNEDDQISCSVETNKRLFEIFLMIFLFLII